MLNNTDFFKCNFKQKINKVLTMGKISNWKRTLRIKISNKLAKSSVEMDTDSMMIPLTLKNRILITSKELNKLW